MAKKTLWQKLNNKLNTKIKIFSNTAILRVNIVHVDKITGAAQATTFEKSVACTQPERVHAGMIDNQLVYAGDMKIPIDYLTMKQVYEEMREVIEFAEWNESTGAIQQPGTDMLEFGGIVYTIRSVIPEDWMNNMPGQYLLILKGVAVK